MFERMTDRARKAISIARKNVQDSRLENATHKDILYGLLSEGSGVGYAALLNLGVDLKGIKRDLESGKGSREEVTGTLPDTSTINRVMEKAREFAGKINTRYVGTEHLAYALVSLERENGILRAKGLTPGKLEIEIRKILGIEIPEDLPTDVYTQLEAAGYLLSCLGTDDFKAICSPGSRDIVGYLRKTGNLQGYEVSLFYALSSAEEVLDLRDWLEQKRIPYREENPDSKPYFIKMLREEATKRTKLADRLEGKVSQ